MKEYPTVPERTRYEIPARISKTKNSILYNSNMHFIYNDLGNLIP